MKGPQDKQKSDHHHAKDKAQHRGDGDLKLLHSNQPTTFKKELDSNQSIILQLREC